MSIGERLTQSDGSYFLFGDDGNLQYWSSSGSLMWETGSTGGSSLRMDSSGLLGIYDASGSSRWSFSGSAGSYLTVENGRPVLYGVSGSSSISSYGSLS